MRTRASIRTPIPAAPRALPSEAKVAPARNTFSANRPWRGPVLGRYDANGPRVSVAFGCDPGIGTAFGVACVPLLSTTGPVPRLPGDVALDDRDVQKVRDALRDCVIWVPHRIDSTKPLELVWLPLNKLAEGCRQMLPLLLSHLAPVDGSIRQVVDEPDGRGDFSELYAAVMDPNRGLGLPLDELRGPAELQGDLIDAIFDLIDPRRGAWARFESILLHLPFDRPDTTTASSDVRPTGEIGFYLASCLYPAGLFDGTPRYGEWGSGPADASLRRLAQMIDRQPREQRPDLLIMTGDQIYADASAGMFDARLISDRLRFAYERLYRGRGATEAFARILPVMLIDDHEIRDNWEPEAPVPESRRPPIDPNVVYQELDNQQQRDEGVRQYWAQQRAHWHPPATRDPLNEPIDVAFNHDGAHFRLVDTRARRHRRTAATINQSTIVTVGQMQELKDWLARTANSGKPRFIDTPSVFLPRHRIAIPPEGDALRVPTSRASALRSDSWDGYPCSQHELLAFLAEQKHENVVFLSGDEHVSFVTWAQITELPSGPSVVIRSIHSSGLYAPFPFANADTDDLADDDKFTFEVGKKMFRCRVETRFFTCGAGFAKVAVTPSPGPGGSWNYRVDFFGEDGVQAYQSSGDAPWS